MVLIDVGASLVLIDVGALLVLIEEKYRLLSSTESGGSPHRFSLAPLDESRWLRSKNHGGYPRRIKSVDLPEDENLQLLVIAIER